MHHDFNLANRAPRSQYYCKITNRVQSHQAKLKTICISYIHLTKDKSSFLFHMQTVDQQIHRLNQTSILSFLCSARSLPSQTIILTWFFKNFHLFCFKIFMSLIIACIAKCQFFLIFPLLKMNFFLIHYILIMFSSPCPPNSPPSSSTHTEVGHCFTLEKNQAFKD